MIRLTKLTLDLAKNEFFNLTELKLRQFDTGYALVFALTDSWREANVDAANLGFRAIKPDKTVIDIKGTGFSKDSEGYWVFNLPKELTQLASPAQKAHIYVQDGENTYTSSDITFYIEPQFGENSGISTENIEEIKRLLETAHSLNTELQRVQNNLQSEKDTLISSSKADAKNAIDKIRNDGENAINKATQDGANAVNKVVADGGNAIDGITTSGNNAVKTVKSDGEAAVNKVIADGETAVNNLIGTGNSTVKQIKDDGETALNRLSEKSETAISNIKQQAGTVTSKIESEGTSTINKIKADGDTAISKLKNDSETAISGINDSGSSAIASISENGEKAIQKIATDGKNKIDEIDEQASSQRTSLQSDYNGFKESLNNDFSSLKSDWGVQLGALEKQIAALQDQAKAISGNLEASNVIQSDLEKDIRDAQAKIDTIKSDLADVDFKGIADTASAAQKLAGTAYGLASITNTTANNNATEITNINNKLDGIKDGTKVVDLINNAGKVKTVSVNGGTKIDPDATGNIDLSIPKNEKPIEKYYQLQLLSSEVGFTMKTQQGCIRLFTDANGNEHFSGEISISFTTEKDGVEWVLDENKNTVMITHSIAKFSLKNIYDEGDYLNIPKGFNMESVGIGLMSSSEKSDILSGVKLTFEKHPKNLEELTIIFQPEYINANQLYYASIRINF